METWENLQARVFHLAWLAEELPAFVATPSGGWLFQQMMREASAIADTAADYLAECERAARAERGDPNNEDGGAL